ncbi:MAG: DUF3656 domain-containing protein [Fibrobacter sp.]|nr:DUF3656 domain-containing protein [Fibrobacter sp.]
MLNTNSPELLLPVGTREMLEAAVKNGANAVYFGVPHWNARGRTEDFSIDDVKEMVEYARLRGVRSYLAMNILIFEQELQELSEFLESIISIKPDGFIIQDIGLARLIRAIAPTQEIHASTQMTLASAEAVNLVKPLGFNRAVLARELSLDEIAKIRENTDLEIEVFIHGALCVSYSGQCLTSENFGGRSANRGQCAQSCRLPYRIFVDGNEYTNTNAQYLFSTRDLCALPRLEQFQEIGIESLKVEGRLKSPEYVAAVTRAYRKALDSKSLTHSDKEPLEVLFSRGLGPGWLDGDNHQELVGGTYSNHHGQYLGKVIKIEKNSVWVESSDREFLKVQKNALLGDGILFEDFSSGASIGARLYGIQEEHNKLKLSFGKDFNVRKVSKNMQAFRNDSPALEKDLRKTFTDRNIEAKIPVDIQIIGNEGDLPELRISDGLHTVSVFGDSPLQKKLGEGDSFPLIQKELSALASTAYEAKNIDNLVSPSAFMNGKSLRALRQKAFALLDNARLNFKNVHASAESGKNFLRNVRIQLKNSGKLKSISISVLVRNPNQIEALQGLPIHKVIMDFDWGVKYDEPLKRIRNLGFLAGMATLRVHKPGENHYLRRIQELKPDFALVRNLGALAILKESGITLTGDYSLNATNSASYQWLLEQGLKTLHPSWDLNSSQLFDLLANIDASQLELTLHQYMPAFHTEYCAFAKSLTTGRKFPECGKICTKHKVEILDHKGERHFLQSDAECRNTLFVGKPQSALKLFPKLYETGVRDFRLEMLQEDVETVRRKVQIYSDALYNKIPIDTAIQRAGIEEKYGLTEGQLFNQNIWHDRKK